MLESQLLPGIADLQMISVERTDSGILVKTEVTSASAACPQCNVLSFRVHSHYQRKITDLPWAGLSVLVCVHVRRFLCCNRECPQKVFCERLTPAVAVYARQTERLKAQLLTLALSMGGELTARVLPKLGMHGSPAMLLNHIRAIPAQAAVPVQVLGLDDWAKRKGQTYGTILVDLDRREIVDLLADRTTATVKAWLASHPEIEIISRDRFINYAKAATEAAPNAVQVADRFHLLKNLYEAVQRALDRHSSVVRQIRPSTVEPYSNQVTQLGCETTFVQVHSGKDATDTPPSHTQFVDARRESVTAKRFQEVKALKQQGLSDRAIARQLGLHRTTVRRYVVHDDVPVRRLAPQSTSTVTPYMGYLRSRIADGCTTYTILYQEIAALGFQGSYASVRRALLPLCAPKRATWRGKPISAAPAPVTKPLSSRQAAWILVCRSEKLKPDEAAMRDALCDACPSIACLYQLAQHFQRIVRGRCATELDSWLAAAHSSRISEMRNFAEGLVRDYSAVKSALTLPWSNGPVEGSVTKLKLLKRQMYGRGKLDLLRLRILNAV